MEPPHGKYQTSLPRPIIAAYDRVDRPQAASRPFIGLVSGNAK